MVQLTQQFEFSAAHRLNCDSLTPEENVAVFGKCNHPSGHGHNYVVEVTVAGAPHTGDGKTLPSLSTISEIVNRNVIDVLDHKHLNEDIDYFAGVNPSVENICIAIFRWLEQDIDQTGGKLANVKVFETPKTWASYAGE